jgi:hypothetical protein
LYPLPASGFILVRDQFLVGELFLVHIRTVRKKKMKKVFGLLVVCSLALSVGCEPAKKPTETKPAETTSTPAPEAPAAEAPAAEAPAAPAAEAPAAPAAETPAAPAADAPAAPAGGSN